MVAARLGQENYRMKNERSRLKDIIVALLVCYQLFTRSRSRHQQDSQNLLPHTLPRSSICSQENGHWETGSLAYTFWRWARSFAPRRLAFMRLRSRSQWNSSASHASRQFAVSCLKELTSRGKYYSDTPHPLGKWFRNYTFEIQMFLSLSFTCCFSTHESLIVAES